MRSIEVTDKSVDIAIFNGLQQLGLSIDEVTIDIIQTETKGILGIGAKPAKVRLTEKPTEEVIIPDFESEKFKPRRNSEKRYNDKKESFENKKKPRNDFSEKKSYRREETDTGANKSETQTQPVEETVNAEQVGVARRRPEKKKLYKNIDEMFAAQGEQEDSSTLSDFVNDELGSATMLSGASSFSPYSSSDFEFSASKQSGSNEKSISEVVRQAELLADSSELDEEVVIETPKVAKPRNDNRRSNNKNNNRRNDRKPPKQNAEANANANAKAHHEASNKNNARPTQNSIHAKKYDYTEEAAIDNPAAEYVKGLLDKMGMEAKVLAYRDEEAIRLRIDSEEIGMLIGRRGENLDAIQYLTSLTVNRNSKDDEYVRVTIDAQQYREKREETLIRLAKRVAQQVRSTGKAKVLEPMNPYERRILHSALQGNPFVSTHSEGEEPNRRVVVTPRRRNRNFDSRRRNNKHRENGEVTTPAFTPDNPPIPKVEEQA